MDRQGVSPREIRERIWVNQPSTLNHRVLSRIWKPSIARADPSARFPVTELGEIHPAGRKIRDPVLNFDIRPTDRRTVFKTVRQTDVPNIHLKNGVFTDFGGSQ
ncbi:hypothetical protein [Thiocystis violacea]|uniref:hypothetical protein n=1 Tax=Thiocystis violacea TaxID=13725 RepID=UPI001903F9A4|nr:hypothetical protein [Thiocystis violacea]